MLVIIYTSVDPKYVLSSSIPIYVRVAHGGKVYRISLNSKMVAGEGELHGRVIFFQWKMACRSTLDSHWRSVTRAPRGDNRASWAKKNR